MYKTNQCEDAQLELALVFKKRETAPSQRHERIEVTSEYKNVSETRETVGANIGDRKREIRAGFLKSVGSVRHDERGRLDRAPAPV